MADDRKYAFDRTECIPKSGLTRLWDATQNKKGLPAGSPFQFVYKVPAPQRA